jgi:ABC-2 type transport system permease protein
VSDELAAGRERVTRGVRHVLRAYPQLLKTGFAGAVAYRAEMLIWMFATNMPLVMLALWTAVARSGPVGPYSQKGFAAYYLSALLVRLLTGSWVVWEMTMEIRQGTLALRLLRPINPLIAYSAENLAAVPLRGIIAIPVVSILLYGMRGQLSHDPLSWLLFAAALFGSWLLTFLVMSLIGTLGLWFESASSLFDAWLGISAVLSGYLIPLDLFPEAVRNVAFVLPFRFQLSFPVELALGKTHGAQALFLLCAQWAYCGFALLATRLVWRAGLRRYAAYGG